MPTKKKAAPAPVAAPRRKAKAPDPAPGFAFDGTPVAAAQSMTGIQTFDSLPVAQTGAPTPLPDSAAESNGSRHKRTFDWSKTPYAVFRSNRGLPIAACATKAEVIAEIQKLSVSEQEQVFVGEVKPIKIETKIVM
jgi:hypothetical protein